MLNGAIAIGALFLALFYGGDIELHSIDVTLGMTFYSAAIHVDPVFLVWVEEAPAAAMTFGNTIIASRWLQGSEKREWILRYEENHVRQCQALGWLMWPASLFVDMDPFRGVHPVKPDYSRPSQADELMWMPPEWWPNLWHWFTLEARFG